MFPLMFNVKYVQDTLVSAITYLNVAIDLFHTYALTQVYFGGVVGLPVMVAADMYMADMSLVI